MTPLILCLLSAGPVEITDSFDAATHPDRKMLRGDYTYSAGVLSVGHNQALYEKFKNHGPIVVYERDFHDAEATLVFRLTPDDTTEQPVRGAFTFDGEKGHVLRVFTSINQPGRVAVWNDGDKKPVMLTRDLPKVKPGEWTTLSVTVKGSAAEITLGGTSVSIEHPALQRAKTNAKYSSAFATMELDEFMLRAE